jgi:AcrR family transcriptional regulator
MDTVQGIVKRSRGRPQLRPDAETRHLIYEAARSELLARGYAGTSMEALACRAGVSTKTLYRLIPTKAELFQGMVTDRLDQFFSSIVADVVDEPDLTKALTIMLIDCATFTLGEEVIGLNRLVIAECDRFPEIAEAFYQNGIQRVPVAIATWLATQCRRGLIALDDPKAAAGMVLGMMISEPQRAAVLRQRKPMTAKEIGKRARICAELFLNGCRSHETS